MVVRTKTKVPCTEESFLSILGGEGGDILYVLQVYNPYNYSHRDDWRTAKYCSSSSDIGAYICQILEGQGYISAN